MGIKAASIKLSQVTSLILAGGESKRLFPLDIPKPLLKVKNKSLLQLALDRVKGTKRYVVLNSKLLNLVKADLTGPAYRDVKFLIEPSARDTAAAISFALNALRREPPAYILILSADQFFSKARSFRNWWEKARQNLTLHSDCIFLAGVNTKGISTESFSQFGWLKVARSNSGSHQVTEFVEKPAAILIKRFLKAKSLINCGIFFATYPVFMEAIRKRFPLGLVGTKDFNRIPKRSFDRVVLQKSKILRVIPLRGGWQDIGTWPQVSRFIGGQKFYQAASRNCFVFNNSKKDIYCFGVEGISVICAGDKVLVCSTAASLRLKNLLQKVRPSQ